MLIVVYRVICRFTHAELQARWLSGALKKTTFGEFEIYPPAQIQLMCWGAPTETHQRELTAAYRSLETLSSLL